MRNLSFLPLSTLLLSCAAATAPLPDDARGRLVTPAPGRRVYHGAVAWRGDTAPSLSYERWVDTTQSSWISTHVTLDPDPIITQRVQHSPTYDFERIDEIDAQLGVVSAVVLRDDGTLAFTRTQGTASRTRLEPPTDYPIVTGPTLFGYTLHVWDALELGGPHELRFVVAEHARTYRFALEMRPTQDGTTTVVMRPLGFIEGLVVEPMRMIFDTRTRTILRYEGSVPPRDRDLSTRRAHVDYTHDTTRFDWASPSTSGPGS